MTLAVGIPLAVIGFALGLIVSELIEVVAEYKKDMEDYRNGDNI